MAIFGTNFKRRLPAGLVAGIIVGATVVLAASGASARDDRRWDHHDRDRDRHWNGGYYPAPPVVYGSPYYAPPPVVYGPGVGLNIRIR
jgi:hypothetical protein